MTGGMLVAGKKNGCTNGGSTTGGFVCKEHYYNTMHLSHC
jgi:hypothetical protein